MIELARLAPLLVAAAVSGLVVPIAYAFSDYPDEPSVLEEVYVGFYFLALFLGVAIAAWQGRRHRNPFTKLPRPVKRRRVRGPGRPKAT